MSDLIEPAPARYDGDMGDVVTFIEHCAKVAAQCSNKSMYGLLQAHGRPFDSPKIKKMRHCLPQRCFNNALMAMTSRYDLTYCEGYAMGPIPLHHAWCLDQQGRVLELTWKTPGTAYFGLAFDRDYVCDHAVKTGYPSILDNMNPRKSRVFDDDPASFLSLDFHQFAAT